MTTAVDETTETTETDDSQEVDENTTPLEELDDLSQMLVARLLKTRDEYLSIFKRIKEATDGAAQKVTDTIAESTDPEVVSRREKLEKLNNLALQLENELQDLVRPTLKIPSEDEVKAMQTEASKLQSVFKGSEKLFDEINSETPVAEGTTPVSVRNYVQPLPGMRASYKPGVDTGIKRPRLKSVEVGKGTNPETVTFKRLGDEKSSTFTHLRKWIKDEYSQNVEMAPLHDAWLKQNHGGEDWSVLPDTSHFIFSVEGKSFVVRITK